MTRLTKHQRHEVENILANVARAARYLRAPSTSVARRTRSASGLCDALTFTRKSVPADLRPRDAPDYEYDLYEVAKEIGSDLTGLWEAERLLRRTLEEKA